MAILNKPVRMCVQCRVRATQNTLLRLQCSNKNLTVFSGEGRSFYLCEDCFEHKNIARTLARMCKSGETQTLMSQLREIIIDVRKS